MVGDDPVAGLVLALGLHARRLLGGADQRAKQVDVVIVVLPLQDGRDALEPHARVDGRTRQFHAFLLRDLLELHEDEVPDLDEAIAVLVGAAGRSAGNALAVVVEDFRTGAAGAGIAHGPEIVAGGDADDPVLGQAGDPLPESRGRVVGMIDGDQQPVLRQAELARDEVPGKLDGALLEIVAEGEIAEHLEEGMMTGGVADIVEVVVLSAGAHAFLRGRGTAIGPRLQPGEDVLELHHAGIGEHQCRIVARHQRARRNDLVALLAEIVEECRPDLVDATHQMLPFSRKMPARPARGTWPFSGRPDRCPETRGTTRAPVALSRPQTF